MYNKQRLGRFYTAGAIFIYVHAGSSNDFAFGSGNCGPYTFWWGRIFSVGKARVNKFLEWKSLFVAKYRFLQQI
jgi:hypothetical protein